MGRLVMDHGIRRGKLYKHKETGDMIHVFNVGEDIAMTRKVLSKPMIFTKPPEEGDFPRGLNMVSTFSYIDSVTMDVKRIAEDYKEIGVYSWEQTFFIEWCEEEPKSDDRGP